MLTYTLIPAKKAPYALLTVVSGQVTVEFRRAVSGIGGTWVSPYCSAILPKAAASELPDVLRTLGIEATDVTP